MGWYAGHFNDGETATRHEVAVEPGPTGLIVHHLADGHVSHWCYDDLVLVEEVYRNRPARFKNRSAPDARLTVEAPDILRVIADHTPQFARRNLLGVHHGGRILGWSVAVVATLALLVWALPRLAEPVAAVIPQSWEDALGRRVVGDMSRALSARRGGSAFCDNPAGVAALRRLTDRLAQTVDTPYRFTVRVLRSKGVNAFAAPGGYVVILGGLIDKATSPDEVAGVLAHEMGHVVERDATAGMIRAMGLMAIVGALTGNTSTIGTRSAQFGATLLSLSYSRTVEARADAVGVGMLNKADISATGLARFFESLSPKPKKKSKTAAGDAAKTRRYGLGDYLRNHPASRARAAAVRAAGTGRGHALNRNEWHALKAICAPPS